MDAPVTTAPKSMTNQVNRFLPYWAVFQMDVNQTLANWIYIWVNDPEDVWSGTYMPSLRLTDQEAADVTDVIKLPADLEGIPK